jgi:oligopeptide transport system substrate-binding protein
MNRMATLWISILILSTSSCITQPETQVIEETVVETQEEPVEMFDGSEPEFGQAIEWLSTKSPETDVQPMRTYHDFLSQITNPSTITIGLQSEITLDPAKTWPWEMVQASDLLFLGLTRIDPATGEVLPELALTFDRMTTLDIEGHPVWVIELRQDVSWVDRDGEIVAPVTAHDAVYAIQRALDRRTEAKNAELLYIIENAEAVHALEDPTQEDLQSIGVWAEDDYTLKIRLTEPASYLPSLLSLPLIKPVPKQVIQEFGEEWIESGEYWSNGPYLFAKLTPEEIMVLCEEITVNCAAINPHYHDLDKIDIAAIRLLSIPTAEMAVANYLNGELDFLELYPQDWDLIASQPELADDFYPIQDYATMSLGFNTSKPALSDRLVRQALAHLVDREMLMATCSEPWKMPATTLLPPIMAGSPALDPTFPHLAYDPALAQQKFDQAGYPGGTGFPQLTLAIHAFRPEHEKMAEQIAQDWNQALGIDVEIMLLEPSYFYDQLDHDPPDIFLTYWYADYPDPHAMLYTNFHSTQGANQIRWSNAEFDQLASQAASEPDPVRRKELYKEAETILTVDEAGIIPIYYYTRVTLAHKDLEIENISVYGGQGWHLWKVQAH